MSWRRRSRGRLPASGGRTPPAALPWHGYTLGGARGTSQGEVRQRWSRAEESMVVNPNNTTIHLDTTQEETEVLDLDQTLTEEMDMAMGTGEEHTTTRTKDDKGEKVKKGKGRKD